MDKKTLILQCAMEQFSEKGSHQATVQDIADAAGIAKGGIYFYYKSKEDLLSAVFAYYYDQLFKSITDVAERYADRSKERLIQQIMVHFNEMSSHYGFLAIFLRGQVEVNDEMKQFAMKMRTKFFILFRDQIIGVYGPAIEPHAFDISALMSSLIREYMGFRLMNEVKIPPREVSEYIVDRMDDAIQGILRSKKAPILTTMLMKSLFPDANIAEGTNTARRLHGALDALLHRFGELQLPEEQMLSIQQAVEVMNDEAGQYTPRRIVLEGMITLLQAKTEGGEWQEIIEVKKIISELT